MWGAPEGSIHFDRGIFSLAESNRAITVTELAALCPGALDTESRAELRHGSNANGCHACEIEIDPETGQVEILRYVAVDDFGVVIDRGTVTGQVHGGIAHGIGQALLEEAPLPAALATPLLTSSFGYSLPSAQHMPPIEWVDNGMPFRNNVLGAKACGESGAAAAPPTVMNAIADALRRWPEARNLQMPAHPAKIWSVIHNGDRRAKA